MEPELETLIAIKKPAWLVGKEFLVLFEGRAVWTILTQLNPDGTFNGLENNGVPYPGTIRQEELMIGIGTRLADDPVLLALQEYKLKPHLFAVAVPGFGGFPGNEQGGGLRAQGNNVRFGVPQGLNNPPDGGGMHGRAPPVQVPQGGPAPQAFSGVDNGQGEGLGRPLQVQIPPAHGEAQGHARTPFPQTPAMRIL
jgi:hypothetical protein